MMGALRTFLALSVFQQHYSFWPNNIWPHGFVAVCCFFLISGFYISLVLTERYHQNTELFYANRLLRLMPVWWIILVITIVANELGALAALDCCNSPTGVMQPSSDYPTWERVKGIASNILLFPVALESMLTGEFGRPMAAGQMYTVGLEILFYLLAPFLARANTRVFCALLVVAGVIHIIPHFYGLPSRPWQYEFFPTVMLFFCLVWPRTGSMLHCQRSHSLAEADLAGS